MQDNTITTVLSPSSISSWPTQLLSLSATPSLLTIWAVPQERYPLPLTQIRLSFFGCAGSSLLCRLFSSCSAQRLLFTAMLRFLTVGLLWLWSTGPRVHGLQQSWLVGFKVQAQ